MSDQPEKTASSNQMLKGIGIGLGIAVLVGGLLYSGMHKASAPQQGGSPAVSAAALAAASQSDADIATAVDKLVATLPSRPANAVFVSDKGREAKAAIMKGDYATASKLAEGDVKQSSLVYGYYRPFNRFIGFAGDTGNEAYLNHLNDWIAQSPKSFIPYMLRSNYYQDTAWWVRGHQFNNKTNPADAKVFSTDIQLAVADALKVIELAPDNPYGYFEAVNAAAAFGNTDAFGNLSTASIQKFPDYYEIASQRLNKLTPKWGGSIESMYDFVDKYAAHASDTSPMRLLYVELYADLLDAAELVCNDVSDEQRTPCVAASMGKLVKPGLESNISKALKLYDKNDMYLFSYRVKHLIGQMQGEGTSAAPFAGAVLQLAADAMGSDNQLIESNPGHNNLFMDELTADKWRATKYYDNAARKYREAIDDAARMKFPSEEAKDLTLAELYSNLAATLTEGPAPDHVQSIAYYKTASKLGTDKSYAVCEEYYRMGDYPGALRECGASSAATGEAGSLFWRAKANRKLGNLDAALADFKAVADDPFATYRAGAVVDGSDLIGSRGDKQGMLDWFARYPFVFDEASTKITQEDLMDAYNNRCYAYKELGQYQKALDDCTTSLRHGSLPDAYQKQQQLVKMLNK